MSAFAEFQIKRKVENGVHNFHEIFKGLENCKILWSVFGGRKKFQKVLEGGKVKVSKHPWIIWVDDKTGTININESYFRKTPKKTLYLDIVHELIHVKQLQQGKDLFDRRYTYVDRPTEIEAYKYTVLAAKELNMSERSLESYLRVDWITPEEHRRLVNHVLGD